MSKTLRRSPLAIAGVCLAVALVAALLALGSWQLQRRVWKLELMERIAQRVQAPLAPAPGRKEWPDITVASHEYRHISASGVWLNQRSTWVQAVTELGSGYWLLAPLRQADGTVLLVNRGFVTAAQRAAIDAQATQEPGAPVSVAGLLRITETGMAFLRHNDAQANRWYARDVQAIATARALHDVAPYFLDAEITPAEPAATATDTLAPVAGLTVLTFYNNHLVYALTWYTLALMVAWAAWRFAREARRPTQQ